MLTIIILTIITLSSITFLIIFRKLISKYFKLKGKGADKSYQEKQLLNYFSYPSQNTEKNHFQSHAAKQQKSNPTYPKLRCLHPGPKPGHHDLTSHHSHKLLLPHYTTEPSLRNPKKIDMKDPKIPVVLYVYLISAIFVVLLMFKFDVKALITIYVFLMTMVTIFLRPGGLNEVYPAAFGAIIVISIGVVSYPNVVDIVHRIGGASITIISTIVMVVVLESFGFFFWAAARLNELVKGSGYRLYWCIQLLCLLMTLLFNNDGSILITTPILILLLRNFQLKPHQQIPYLLSGAFIATASSAPIGVSNIVNLISLNIVHITLYEHTAMMFVPATIGLLFMSVLMFLMLKRRLPHTLPRETTNLDDNFFTHHFRPFKNNFTLDTKQKRTKFMLKLLLFVFGIRCLLFAASYIGIPIEFVAVLGSAILLLFRWYFLRTKLADVLKKTPWHILIFALSMYTIIFGLNNIGLTEILVKFCEPIVNQGLFNASFLMGGIISVLSNIFNNHPALMIGTITLQNMGLTPITLKMIYLSNIIGSDIGSLFLPIGTLASLLWMDILKRNNIKVTWRDYLNLSFFIIPLTVLFTLFILYFWIQIVFA